jgi:hypothetical protein
MLLLLQSLSLPPLLGLALVVMLFFVFMIIV